ncbi:cytochrome b [Burkholderia pseudomallei]|uniref:Cytochrome b n=5 Tax=Burkholderia pseudomallei TaxID=28450 RepID=A0AAX0UCL9_BURPE|nr:MULTISPECIES: cytochrome b [Burkholderia]KGW50011.1 prokaryotic cytochrome b561 family protein [Burkholderia pseudomallei MSHR684]KGX77308.1 prokaryotic cytochrome b561 family protein [Burkholderia pseudomallei MSHR435]ABN92102.1 putative [Ni] hydrogenase, b-type cytochrome subunit [Burkholderia pseudomallei 1106a]ACQ96035.1 cytochrome B561 [Burkholderia pseudomallei MSHR346]AFR13977.1 putative [Ni] hydrogenase, b-type cytochrome subunit [Burkholderia pseudomallei BPC006]
MMKTTFSPLARLLHWVMAAMIVSMLFVGAGMVTTVSGRHAALVAMHKPLGVAVLVLACVRVVVRLSSRPPALPADLPGWQKFAAHGSHLVLYALMIAMPLVGWAMLSAGGYPVTLGGGVRLPSIVPADAVWFAWLRHAHRWLAYLFFATFLAHFAAALYHGMIRRDGVLRAMVGR